MAITTTVGNLFLALPKDKEVIVPHVCNNIGGWGSGFVLAVNSFSMKPLHMYKKLFEGVKEPSFIGHTQFVEVGNIHVANMIAQHQVVGMNDKPIRYEALVKCMRSVEEYASWMGINTIYAPMFGSGLAQGNWNIIKELIAEIWGNLNVTIFVLK